ncbi:RNA polymerase II-associated protein 3 [Mycena venus]|uniref:RNA polymerase II-associated protein 3 n=1 Tax=Mycena venus TaxID=2733690 RepID=A0A8H7D2A5_9AGAR|nr:RNA polymerase II-associated protein 3 [Mycena venus]
MAEQVNVEKAGALFRNERYAEAAALYEIATLTDPTCSKYFANLSVAYLKLKEFSAAHSAAHNALLLDCRSVKARYRRAMARKGQGLLGTCLIDLYSVLITDPANKDARTAFTETLRVYDVPGKQTLNSQNFLAHDNPPAYGSLSSTAHITRPPARAAAPNTAARTSHTTKYPHAVQITVSCAACGNARPRNVVKVCRQCKTAAYCKKECQRAHWPKHKDLCSLTSTHKVLLRLAEKLNSTVYIRSLFRYYGMRALGLLATASPVSPGLVIITVGLCPLDSGGVYRNRLRVQQITAVPIAVLPDDVMRTYHDTYRDLRTHFPAGTHPVVLLINPDVGDQAEAFGEMQACSVFPSEIALAKEPGFALEVYSNSLGTERRIVAELDHLFRAVEDEIELDVDNHCGLRA